VTALAFRANAAVKMSANSAARAATLYLFLFFMVESALGFFVLVKGTGQVFLGARPAIFSESEQPARKLQAKN
jgi:hypothetical protein